MYILSLSHTHTRTHTHTLSLTHTHTHLWTDEAACLNAPQSRGDKQLDESQLRVSGHHALVLQPIARPHLVQSDGVWQWARGREELTHAVARKHCRCLLLRDWQHPLTHSLTHSLTSSLTHSHESPQEKRHSQYCLQIYSYTANKRNCHNNKN
jgi:hypothetical protein